MFIIIFSGDTITANVTVKGGGHELDSISLKLLYGEQIFNSGLQVILKRDRKEPHPVTYDAGTVCKKGPVTLVTADCEESLWTSTTIEWKNAK